MQMAKRKWSLHLLKPITVLSGVDPPAAGPCFSITRFTRDEKLRRVHPFQPGQIKKVSVDDPF